MISAAGAKSLRPHTSASRVEIVLGSTREDDLTGLAAILKRSAWNIVQAPTCKQVACMAADLQFPILLCDLRLEFQPWQETLRQLLTARCDASVLFLANETDRAFSREVARHGGFDLLTRPFERDQVFESLLFAYSRHKLSWPIAFIGHDSEERLRR